MMNKVNFPKMLEAAGFSFKNNIYSKKIKGETIQANIADEKLIYPKNVKIEGEFTTNFSSAENFVVFECVNRLLELGYKPGHLTLEPKWQVGHGPSGGRADIVIKDNEGKVFAIIECKTAGKGFDEAWNIGLQYPSQLFSYAQQEGTTQLLCLYTSNFINDVIERQYYIIPLLDNESLLETKAEEALTYEKAKRFDEKFNVWKDTYLNEAFQSGFFEKDIQPFHFGRKNYSVTDLKEISHNDIQKKYHQFATILRKYNVSGRENAFDKLVNLFLCKVVDEQQNPTDLGFYWKGRAYDNDFELQDRLQRLYQQGMKQFLNEDVTYINQEQIDEAFRFLEKDDDHDATKETINRYFKQLKFFTNNDFAFIDVHNERLFKENADVLRSIVEMLQDIKLKSDSDGHSNQFLGDMFEGFLDAGIKQSEGQFFTPMPIVKFIINSLPLQDVIIKSEQPPKAIDYACGAGHFLTELAMQMKPLVKQYKKADIGKYYSNITGLEKEYRLSKVAKVSAFMYGQDEINIIYADALAKNEGISNGTYHILVANPPYSVKGFLETLKHTERHSYELFGSIDEKSIITNNSIETFFVERAKQLLAPDGIAAIILPSSVLSNDAQQYRQTRQILLQHFHIVAIAELGSGTFGKTGTNTVTLFLRRRKQNPDEATHYRYRAECWIGGDVGPRTKKNKEYNDLHLLEAYCNHIGIAFDDYKSFLQEGAPNEALHNSEIWKEYEKAFYDRTDIKNYQKKPVFKRLLADEQMAELNEMLYHHIRQIEQEKIYYFLLALSNAVPVLIIKSPTDNKAVKKFLGYEWSAAKGSEGIKYLNAATVPDVANEDEPVLTTVQLNSIQTPLYNPVDKNDPIKLNYYISENFSGKAIVLPDELNDFAHTAYVKDMLDFSRKDFNKAISLTPKKAVEVVSKWEVKLLGEIASLAKGKSITQKDTKPGKIKVVAGGIDFAYFHNKSNRPANTITVSASGASAGYVNFWTEPIFASDCTTVNTADDDLTYYIYVYLQSIQDEIYSFARGAAQPHVYSDDLKSIKIPVPPKKVQQSIIAECRAIDDDSTKAQKEIDAAKKEIEKKVEDSKQEKYPLRSIQQIAIVNPSKTELKDLDDDMMVSFIEMASVSNSGFIEKKEDRTLKSLRKGSYTYFAEGDIIIAKITPCMENGKCALARDLTNAIGLGSSEFHVFRCKDEVLPSYLFYQLNRQMIREEARKKMTGSSGHRRVPISFYENLKIPILPLSAQGKLVAAIEILEAQVATAQHTIAQTVVKKRLILKRWLA